MGALSEVIIYNFLRLEQLELCRPMCIRRLTVKELIYKRRITKVGQKMSPVYTHWGWCVWADVLELRDLLSY
jgi:hypothetical protein